MRIIKSEESLEFIYIGRCIRQLIIGTLMIILMVSIASDVLNGADWRENVFLCFVFLCAALFGGSRYGIFKYKLILDSEGIYEKRFLLKNRTILWSEIESIDVKNVPYNRSNAYFAVFFEASSIGRKKIIKTVPFLSMSTINSKLACISSLKCIAAVG